ncbi:hypothetical protein GW17_00033592 [Ensete ventricosum]|nr:hypothetical protein GW17_00033592 [Ensete ventricosum]
MGRLPARATARGQGLYGCGCLWLDRLQGWPATAKALGVMPTRATPTSELLVGRTGHAPAGVAHAGIVLVGGRLRANRCPSVGVAPVNTSPVGGPLGGQVVARGDVALLQGCHLRIVATSRE